MKRKLLSLWYISVCMFGIVSFTQAYEIHGTVTDPSGAVITGASVRLISGDKKKAFVVSTTDNNGHYSIHGEQLCAPCQLGITAAGFTPFSREVKLSTPEGLALHVRLKIAAAPESVDVVVKSQPFRDQLDMSEVRESSAKDIGEALTVVDGVYKIRKGGIANDIVVRGFQQNNVSVLIDGARIYGACPGHMDPAIQHADFSEVERVDIVKGAFDVGNAGSLGASVNVVTKTPPLGLHLTPSFSAGSFGFYNPSITASAGNEKFRALAGYSYRISDPYEDGSGKSFLTYANYGTKVQNKRAFDINTGWFETELATTAEQKLSLAYTRQQSGLVLYPYKTMDSDYDNADRVSLKYEVRNLSSSVRAVHGQIYFTQVIHFMSDQYRKSAGISPWMMAANARSRSIGGRISAEAGRDFIFGADGYYRNWNMMGYVYMMSVMTVNQSLPNVDTNTVGTFAEYHHAFTDRFILTGGIRFDHDSMSTGVPNLNTNAYYNYHGTRRTSVSDDYASGNARLSYTFPHSIELFAGVGSNGRIPDAEERFFNRASMAVVNVGNPSLPIVRNTESTAGVIVHHGSSYIKPALFYSNVSDYILVNNQALEKIAMTPKTARSYTNVDAHIYGGEISYALALPRSFSWVGGGAYSKGTNQRKPLAGVFDSNLPEMPPMRSWAALRYVHRFVFAELGGSGVARQKLVDKDLKEMQTAGYGLMNAKLGFAYRKLNASFMVDNLLNHYYYEHLSYYRDPFSAGVKVPEPGRNFFGQVKYSF